MHLLLALLLSSCFTITSHPTMALPMGPLSAVDSLPPSTPAAKPSKKDRQTQEAKKKTTAIPEQPTAIASSEKSDEFKAKGVQVNTVDFPTLRKRGIVQYPKHIVPPPPTTQSGKIGVRLCVAQNGTVLSAAHVPEASTSKDHTLIEFAETYFKQYQFEPLDEDAVQCSMMYYYFTGKTTPAANSGN